MIRLLLPLLILFSALTALEASEPATKVTLTIYHGQNHGIEDDLVNQPDLKKSLKNLVGYDLYKKVGSSVADLGQGGSQELTPSKVFRLVLMPSPKDKRILAFELFQMDKSILKGEFVPRPLVPLIITGPEYDKGRLVLVMTCSSDDCD